jgi:hypothetical protein
MDLVLPVSRQTEALRSICPGETLDSPERVQLLRVAS